MSRLVRRNELLYILDRLLTAFRGEKLGETDSRLSDSFREWRFRVA